VSQLSDDPFAKVKTLIEELIERLLKEAANEATQKGWCDKSMSAATQKRDYAAEKIAELNGNMAELEATRDKLAEELEVLTEEIKELKKARKEAEAMRKQEAKEHEIIISEAKVGKEAMEEAIKIIDRYYKKARKSEVKLSLAQQSPSFDLAESAGSEGSYNPETINTAKPTESPVTPGDQAPDSGFDSGEAYTGAKGVEGGILGMLEVIESDFERTITETEKAEQQAQQEHLEFMTETGKSLAEKEVAESEKTKQKDDAESKLQDDKDSLVEQTDILKTSVEELIQLHGACVDTGMTWEERIAAREDEIEALKKALCILEAYEKYGPRGIGDDGSC
jgi:chromosome segregation ATPase